ncbi:ATP-grasp domain-containing protein [Halomonas sp. M4R1S46]|uniref:ATP-grasp domain-containing protein n=1 Tax=Halomonas sp. M4R1S46 TaxID=2982692 RepID=UPI0021E42526|nr:ATP-grasp domain-containing protein [Halomonas sp. M4R1S46]UYG06243.1 ATP-grasp domain-containing protein [Halomonas sp. M4R1S46]
MVIMILGGGQMQRPAYLEAKKRGLEVVGVDPSRNAPCIELADHFYFHDLQDVSGLGNIVEKHQIDGVMTLSADYPVKAVGILNSRYQLPGITEEVVSIVSDKGVLRQHCHGSGITSPSWLVQYESTGFDIDKIMAMIPVVVKPTCSSGGRGVTCIRKGDSVSQLNDALAHACKFSKNGGVIIESYISGKEYSAETITSRGITQVIAITEKITSGHPFYMEVGHNIPYIFDDQEWSEVKQFLYSVINGIGIDNSPAHIEFKVDEGVPVLVEVGARLGGGFITTDLIPLASGINMVSAAISLCMGTEPQTQRTHSHAAAIRYLIPPAGLMKGIKGIDKIAKLNEVVKINCEYLPDCHIPVIRDADGRKAFVIGKAENIERLEAVMKVACDYVEYEMS